MEMSEETVEQIHNIEKTLWSFRPVWLFTTALSIVFTTASIILWFVRYDSNNDRKIDAVSIKVDRFFVKLDRQHLTDSLTAVERYNYLVDAINDQREGKSRVSQPSSIPVAGYIQHRDADNNISYEPYIVRH